ncbi:diguanylate cyclase [Oceanispirochaeta sp.]|jgi:diguanylate cyclase (GGDEF)-like protein|uniref:diguanylate cyclase n=1 Tax=Oceanispirochaeta sp. TaxID=2035350 RepID=UPI00261C8203|nr:diguanylate cyclase [Oceanispirochaeta sp.]MDA3955171.1 diguanylate cyclase [Oceanispirochaeta sp.]
MNKIIIPEYDINGPVEIAPRIWWVGHYLKGDPFQCHCYLIENGMDSILIDPGSRLTFKHSFAKIEKILPFTHIRYFVVHHQDPDITGALDIIDQLNCREDACILSHWRAIALLKHLGLDMPLFCVEEMNWSLTAGERELEFIFTPYLHFSGAFCTFDRKTGSLFSSDLMGGFTDDFSLYAKDESYLDSVKLFHEHYMPSREILAVAMDKFQKLPLERILPQHGSIITGHLIPYILEQLKNLDCGLFLLAQTSTEIIKLSKLNRFMNDFMETIVFHRHYDTIAKQLLKNIQEIIPALSFQFLIIRDEDHWQLLEEKTRYQGTPYKPERLVTDIYRSFLKEEIRMRYIQEDKDKTVVLPLKDLESGTTFALALIEVSQKTQLDDETESILLQISNPLCIAIEREIMQQQLDHEKQSFYELSIKDPLTGLYNRTYMNETIPRIFSHHDRGVLNGIALLMLDLDHFKTVNDTYGHQVGDVVLTAISRIILDHLRVGDIAVRVGGEEFSVFLILEDLEAIRTVAQRILLAIKNTDFSEHMKDRIITISGGLAIRKKEESPEDLFARADSYLYQAKRTGRDRIVESLD